MVLSLSLSLKVKNLIFQESQTILSLAEAIQNTK